MYGRRGFYAMPAAGGGTNKTIINPIMLRFRPIAPKPDTGTSGSGETQPDKKKDLDTKARRKRKYVRGKRNNRCKTKKPENGNEAVDRTVSMPPVCSTVGSDSNRGVPVIRKFPVWLNFDGKLDQKSITIDHSASDRSDLTAVIPLSVRTAESCVTVECVTTMDAFHSHGGGVWLGKTDVERMKNLEVDTCPAFVSDGSYSVQWINQSYREMVAAEEEEEEGEGGERSPPETAVKLVVKEGLPVGYPAFACRVRVEYYTWRKSKRSRTMPCDVWKMDYGGFAWRLDVQTALSLGR